MAHGCSGGLSRARSAPRRQRGRDVVRPVPGTTGSSRWSDVRCRPPVSNRSRCVGRDGHRRPAAERHPVTIGRGDIDMICPCLPARTHSQHHRPSSLTWLDRALLTALSDCSHPDCASCGWSHGPCCAGTPSWSLAAGPTRDDTRADHPSPNPSGRWCCGWPGRTHAGDTDASTASWSASATGSPRQRCGRSSRPPASIPLRAGPDRPGASSWPRRPRRSSRSTSPTSTPSSCAASTSWS